MRRVSAASVSYLRLPFLDFLADRPRPQVNFLFQPVKLLDRVAVPAKELAMPFRGDKHVIGFFDDRVNQMIARVYDDLLALS